MRSLHASLALAAVLATLAGCDDGGGGEGGAGGAGEGGAGGDTGPGPSSGTDPWWSTTGGGPLRTAEEICAGACACDPECAASSALFVPDCVDRFEEDQQAATLANCSREYDAYYGCFSRSWTCEAPDACDEESEALGACLAILCDTASGICGCVDCTSECRTHDERCTAQCIVESNTCYGDDPAFYECIDACYGIDSSSSSGGAGGGFVAGE